LITYRRFNIGRDGNDRDDVIGAQKRFGIF